MPREAPVREAREFDPRQVSASRVQALTQCGVAFKYRYIDGLPGEISGSAALFGKVIHDALEWWAPDRSQELPPLVEAAWEHNGKDNAVGAFLREYRPLSTQAIKVQHEIQQRRPEIKAPRMTGDWKKSAVAKDINRLLAIWIPKLEADSPWRFSQYDPLPQLYDDSRQLALRYQERARAWPNSLHTEFEFNVEWRGFRLTGFIDSIEPIIDATGELRGVGIVDYKTYAKAPVELKDYRQLVMYDVAVRDLVARGQLQLPLDIEKNGLLVGVDFVRWTDKWDCPPRRFWRITEADHDRLERELNTYGQMVDHGDFLPAEKGRNPDFCDYPSMCCLRTCNGPGGGAELVEIKL
jgi:RecB family exonuclease